MAISSSGIGNIFLVDQLTGSIQKLDKQDLILGQPDSHSHGIIQLKPQIFHNLVLTNYSDDQLRLLESSSLFSTAKLLERDHTIIHTSSNTGAYVKTWSWNWPTGQDLAIYIIKSWIFCYVFLGSARLLAKYLWPILLRYGLHQLQTRKETPAEAPPVRYDVSEFLTSDESDEEPKRRRRRLRRRRISE